MRYTALGRLVAEQRLIWIRACHSGRSCIAITIYLTELFLTRTIHYWIGIVIGHIENQIESDVDGIVERILVQGGDPVEYDQALFLISLN